MSKPKLNYLTEEELKTFSREDANLQVALGLRTCKILKDVTELLDDIRAHERYLLSQEACK